MSLGGPAEKGMLWHCNGDMGKLPCGIHLSTFFNIGTSQWLKVALCGYAQGLQVSKGIFSKAMTPSWHKTAFLEVGLSGLLLGANLCGCFINFPSVCTRRSASEAKCAENN